MALEDILETIGAEAARTASEVMASARAEAESLLERARGEAEQEEQRLAASLDDRTRMERSRIVSRSRLDAARARRRAREEIYQDAREEVARRLRSIRSSPDYEAVLESLFDEAMAVLPSATSVRVDPEDADAIRGILLSRNLDLAIETQECPMGGVVVIADGRSVDNRLGSRLERIDQHLRYIAGEMIPDLRGGSG